MCRIGDVAVAWIMGGAVDADELDGLLEMLQDFGKLLEAADRAPGTGERRTPVR